jgi:flagellar P-ring protein precursor FlgI
MKTKTLNFWALAIALVLQPLAFNSAMADRIKDLTSVAGARPNQLIGYGLVVGLR